MTLQAGTAPIPLSFADDGVIRVARTRVTFDTVIEAFSEGATAEEIAQQYPSLKLADVYHVLGYYLNHQQETNDYLRQRLSDAGAIRKQNEKQFDPNGIRDRLLARR